MKKAREKSGLLLKGKLDIGFLTLVISLLTIGLIMLFSASYPYAEAYFNNSYHFILRQFIFAAVGIFFMFLFSKINYRLYKKFAWLIYKLTKQIFCKAYNLFLKIKT